MPNYVDLLGDAVRSVIPMPNRWFLEPGANQRVQPLVQRVMQASGRTPKDFASGAFVDPQTMEVLDGRIFSRGTVDAWDGRRPQMFVEEGTPLAAEGGLLDANLVRRALWEPVDSPDLDGLGFLSTVEAHKAAGVPAKHYYARRIEYDTPVLLRNTYGGSNPTLRPRARGSVFAAGDLGQMMMRSSGQVHPVYDTLRIVDRNAYPSIPAGDRNRFGQLLRYSLLAPASPGTEDLLNQQPEESMAPASGPR
jgi:hypothetical protein